MSTPQSSTELIPTGSRVAIKTLDRMIQMAYKGDAKHSLMANLTELRDDEWTMLPPGGTRSIAEIVEHVAWVKWMYEDYTFGSASLKGDQPPLVPADGTPARPREELLTWLADGHRRWLTSFRTLSDDAELERPRPAHFGQMLPTHVLVGITIAHDHYHAGEINHLRALLQGTDRWPGR